MRATGSESGCEETDGSESSVALSCRPVCAGAGTATASGITVWHVPHVEEDASAACCARNLPPSRSGVAGACGAFDERGGPVQDCCGPSRAGSSTTRTATMRDTDRDAPAFECCDRTIPITTSCALLRVDATARHFAGFGRIRALHSVLPCVLMPLRRGL